MTTFKQGWTKMHEFHEYIPLAEKFIMLNVFVPSGDPRQMHVLFVIHGGNPFQSYQMAAAWQLFAETEKYILIAPQYLDMNGLEYQFGGVSSSEVKFVARPKTLWTYSTIESIFDYVQRETGNTSTNYDIYGFSWGGEFVHRFLLWMPNARVRYALAGGTGAVTLPLGAAASAPSPAVAGETSMVLFPSAEGMDAVMSAVVGETDGVPTPPLLGFPHPWPYSLAGTSLTQADVQQWLARPLALLIGEKERAEPDDKPQETAQGETPVERNRLLYETGRGLAEEEGWEFRWLFRVQPGIGHHWVRCVTDSGGAAEILKEWITNGFAGEKKKK